MRGLPESQEREPDVSITAKPGDWKIVEEASVAANAAMILAKLGDRESLPAIRELAVTAGGEDRKLLEAALERLKE